jgi:hypothetical protein
MEEVNKNTEVDNTDISDVMNSIKKEWDRWDKPSVELTDELIQSHKLITRIKELLEIKIKSQSISRHDRKMSNNLKKILIELNTNLKKFNSDWRNEESPF